MELPGAKFIDDAADDDMEGANHWACSGGGWRKSELPWPCEKPMHSARQWFAYAACHDMRQPRKDLPFAIGTVRSMRNVSACHLYRFYCCSLLPVHLGSREAVHSASQCFPVRSVLRSVHAAGAGAPNDYSTVLNLPRTGFGSAV